MSSFSIINTHNTTMPHIDYYYITFNYRPCNIPPALLNNKLAISISSPINNITVGPGPISLFDPTFLQFDYLTLNA